MTTITRPRKSTQTREHLGKRVVKRGQVTVHSDILNLDFQTKLTDPRAKRLEMLISIMEYAHINRGSKVRQWP